MPEYTGYIHQRCEFDLKLLKDKNCIVVEELCEDGVTPHYHFWLNDHRKEAGLRTWFVEHFSPTRGAKSYSLKLCDPEKKESYFRYMCKGTGETSEPIIIYNASRIDTATYHKQYYETQQKHKGKNLNRKPAFAVTLCQIFEEKHKQIYEDSYLIDHSDRYTPGMFKLRRLKYLAKIVISSLNAETKILDEFIIKRFVLMLENRFNHDAFAEEFSQKIAEGICTFGN